MSRYLIICWALQFCRVSTPYYRSFISFIFQNYESYSAADFFWRTLYTFDASSAPHVCLIFHRRRSANLYVDVIGYAVTCLHVVVIKHPLSPTKRWTLVVCDSSVHPTRPLAQIYRLYIDFDKVATSTRFSCVCACEAHANDKRACCLYFSPTVTE